MDFNSDKSYVEPYRKDYGKYGYNGELKTLLTSGEGFKPIGQNDYTDGDDATKQFTGTFDGDGKIILNLYINLQGEHYYTKAGFFSMNCGTIKKLGLERVNIKLQTTNIISTLGSIAGQNAKTGIIENCYSKGKMESSCRQVGGLAAYCSGTIENCYSDVDITNNIVDYDNDSKSAFIQVGGIVAGTAETTVISNCYNLGEINNCTNNNSIGENVGGIVGYLLRGKMENCYNGGRVKNNSNNSAIVNFGGAVGEEYKSTMENCYSKGQMELNTTNVETLRVGGFIGKMYDGVTMANCYYLSSIAEKGCGEGTDTTIAVEKESDMPSILSVVGNAFKEDTNNINNGYPILDWQ